LLYAVRFRNTLSALMASLLLAVSFDPAAATAKTRGEKVDYVALGDSLAAGQTPYKEIDKGYTDFLADRLDTIGYLGSYLRYAVPGYTTEDVLEDIKHDVEKGGKSIREAIEDAEMITLDAGANDLLHELTITDKGVSTDPEKVPAIMDQVYRNLKAIMAEIKEENPDAEVYIMGYYNAFPYLPKDQQEQLLPVLDKLNKTIAKVTAKTRAHYVPTEDVIAENFRTYLPNPQDIHLSKEGYQAVANEFWDKLKGEFPVQKLKVNKPQLTLKEGDVIKLRLTATYANGRTITVTELAEWKSSNKNIASVENGVVKARKKGSVTITVFYDDKKLSIPVKVKE
jgi:lysophospholipase L1-like esterase